tara:strand:- start:1754 stop:1981 length:228 start_codon:yes stop_codon:yes gene_type:complete
MNKVIIRTREDELTTRMFKFGNDCALQFINSVEREQYGPDWSDCMYTNAVSPLKCWVTLSKSGTVSACVFSKSGN